MSESAKAIIHLNWLFEANIAQFRIIFNKLKSNSTSIFPMNVPLFSAFQKHLNTSFVLLKQGEKMFNNGLRTNQLSQNFYVKIYNLYIKRSHYVFVEGTTCLKNLVYEMNLKNNPFMADLGKKVVNLDNLMREMEKNFLYLVAN